MMGIELMRKRLGKNDVAYSEECKGPIEFSRRHDDAIGLFSSIKGTQIKFFLRNNRPANYRTLLNQWNRLQR